MSENPKPFADDEAISAVVPIAPIAQLPVLDVELDRVHDALPAGVMTMPADTLIDEMLKRLNEHDYLATLLLADLIVRRIPGHGLAMVCRKEALTALEPMLQAPLTREWPANARWASLDEHATKVFGLVDGTTTTATLLSACPDPTIAVRALHELVRVGAVQAARAATVLERSNTIPAPSSK